MSMQTWQELINVMLSAGSALTAAAEALLVPDVTIPANYMYPGRVLRAVLTGIASNAVTTPGTLQLRTRWGGLAGTLIGDSGQLTQNVAAQTDKVWVWEVWILCVSAGTSGQFRVWGRITRGNCAVAAASDIAENPTLFPRATNALVTVDTTVAKALSFTATPSLGTASITCQAYTLESQS